MGYLLPGRVTVYPGTNEIVVLERKRKKEATKAAARVAHAQAKTSNGDVSILRRRKVLHDYGYRCWYCGMELVDRWGTLNPDGEDSATIDHFVPLSRGGTNALDNLVPACRSCNGAKGSQTVEEFRYTCRREVFAAIRTREWLERALEEQTLGPFTEVIQAAIEEQLRPQEGEVIFWGESEAFRLSADT